MKLVKSKQLFDDTGGQRPVGYSPSLFIEAIFYRPYRNLNDLQTETGTSVTRVSLFQGIQRPHGADLLYCATTPIRDSSVIPVNDSLHRSMYHTNRTSTPSTYVTILRSIWAQVQSHRDLSLLTRTTLAVRTVRQRYR